MTFKLLQHGNCRRNLIITYANYRWGYSYKYIIILLLLYLPMLYLNQWAIFSNPKLILNNY